MDQDLYTALNPNEINLDNRMPYSSLISNKSDAKLSSHSAVTNGKVNGPSMAQRWQVESNLYVDTARLLISLLNAWNFDEKLDELNYLKEGLKQGKSAVMKQMEETEAALKEVAEAPFRNIVEVHEEMRKVHQHPAVRQSPFEVRRRIQQQKWNLPFLPITTIGSFPRHLK